MKNGRMARSIALILASAFLLGPLAVFADDPPPGLLHKIAERENQNALARADYTYRQSVTLQEINDLGKVTGEYRTLTDVTFSPTRGRYEQPLGPPVNTLTRLKLTPEDFTDIRNINPLLLTTAQVSLYEGQYKGEQMMDGYKCFIVYVRPRQILAGQRFFEGMLWVRESDFSVVRSEGQSVPQIETTKSQNLTPHFTTIRQLVDNKWFFPTETYADDTLFFRDWPQRVRVIIRYSNYRKFGAESTVTFGDQQSPPPPAEKK